MADPTQRPRARNGGFRRKAFAALWKAVDAAVDEQVREAKDDILRDLPERVVEIGAGRGSNFARYAPGTEVTVFEPNVFMHGALEDRAVDLGLRVDLRASDLRDARLPSGSEAAVVSTLTMCSVSDRVELVAEIHRILRPGGRLFFIEHIAETSGRGRVRFQRLVRRPWSWLFDECDVCADTNHVIAEAGFTSVDATTRNLGPALDPTNLTHWGVATK